MNFRHNHHLLSVMITVTPSFPATYHLNDFLPSVLFAPRAIFYICTIQTPHLKICQRHVQKERFSALVMFSIVNSGDVFSVHPASVYFAIISSLITIGLTSIRMPLLWFYTNAWWSLFCPCTAHASIIPTHLQIRSYCEVSTEVWQGEARRGGAGRRGVALGTPVPFPIIILQLLPMWCSTLEYGRSAIGGIHTYSISVFGSSVSHRFLDCTVPFTQLNIFY